MLIVFSLHRKLLKLILVDEPLSEVVVSHEVAHFEGNVSSSLIGITFLMRLCNLQVLPDHLDVSLGIF
jgi:hypothetical protein